MGDAPVNLKKDLGEAIHVLQRDGTVVPLTAHSSFMSALERLEALPVPGFIAVPRDIFRHFVANERKNTLVTAMGVYTRVFAASSPIELF